MGCNFEDLPEAMNDRETWRERVRDIRASRTTWWWWWWWQWNYMGFGRMISWVWNVNKKSQYRYYLNFNFIIRKNTICHFVFFYNHFVSKNYIIQLLTFKSYRQTHPKYRSSHRSISSRKSMPLLSDSATHWPIKGRAHWFLFPLKNYFL